MGSWVQGCPKGTPDLLAIVNMPNNKILALFLELKSSVGKLRKEQKDFYIKYNNTNIQTMIIRDVKEFDNWINSHSLDTTKGMKQWSLK